MRILLIGPLTAYGRRRLKYMIFPLQSLSLPTVAALTPEKHEVYVHDINEIVRNGKIKNILYDADLVGVSVLTPYANDANLISEMCRKNGIYTVHGGPHASALPGDSKADTVFIGEVEKIWEKFLDDFEKKKPQRFYIDNEKRPSEISLKEPRRELLPKTGMGKVLDYTASVEYSRGCPYHCEYCCVPLFGKGYSVRPVEEVTGELKKIKQKNILFVSNNLVGRPEHTKKLLREMAPLGKKWIGGIPPESVVEDQELVKYMKNSGCVGLFYGFESLSKEYLKMLKNPQKKLESYETCIKITKDNGIVPEISFMLGLDYDDRSVFENVIRFVEKNKIPLVSLNIATPLPGTKLYQRMKEEDRIIDHDWGHYDFDTVVFKPKLMEPDELQRGFDELLKEIYSLGNLKRRLWDEETLKHPWVIPANVIYDLTL